MARLSARVKTWRPQRGKGKCKTDIYYAQESNLDTLLDIHIQNKSWGNEWYELVKLKSYENAKMLIAVRGKGDCLPIAMNILDDLIALEKEGGDK